MNLNKFLSRAKKNTYASKYRKVLILEDGSKELIYEEGEFRYRDKYFGFNPFSGQEIVWKNKKVVWTMNYRGQISGNDTFAKEIYNFLKKCLLLVEEDLPLRGPMNHEEGSFTYENETDGNVKNFSGNEWISFADEVVYTLEYHGGIVK